MLRRFLEWLLLEPGDKIVRVKSWKPVWLRGCIEWPCLLVDSRSQRRTAWPVWGRQRFLCLFSKRTT